APYTGQGDGLARICYYSDSYKVFVPYQSVCRIKFRPSTTGQEDAYPSMGISPSGASLAVICWNVQIARDKPRCQTKATHCLHHEHCKIATTSLTQAEGLLRRLGRPKSAA